MSIFRMLDTARATLICCLNISCCTSVPSRRQQQNYTVLCGISDITTNISVTEHNSALLLGERQPQLLFKDYAPFEGNDGRQMPSYTESTYRTYSASRFPTEKKSITLELDRT